MEESTKEEAKSSPPRISRTVGLTLLCVALILVIVARSGGARIKPVDTVPQKQGKGSTFRNGPHVVLNVAGTPEEMGRQYGLLQKKGIQLLIRKYVRQQVCGGNEETLSRYRELAVAMMPSLPSWYVTELKACAKGAGVDDGVLLLAQCEGDIRSLGGGPDRAGDGCSAYIALPSQGTPMHVGRNFDYSGADFIRQVALVSRYNPNTGLRFTAVGWSGVLGGWTLVNEKGLIVANHLGGGRKTNAKGIPTLILTRMIAQQASTVEEGIELIKNSPRMRGQIVWLAQDADSETGRQARAVAVEYDAESVAVRESHNKLLVVTNTNLLLGKYAAPAEPTCSRYKALTNAVGLGLDHPIQSAGQINTLHSCEIFPHQGYMMLSHGRVPAHEGGYVRHPLPMGTR